MSATMVMKWATAASTQANSDAAIGEALAEVKNKLAGAQADAAFLFVTPHKLTKNCSVYFNFHGIETNMNRQNAFELFQKAADNNVTQIIFSGQGINSGLLFEDRYNDDVNLCKDHLREVFIKGLMPKNKTIYAINFGHNLPLNELVEILIQMEKETVNIPFIKYKN